MRHENSVLHDLLKRVPWDEFDRLVTAHRADHRVRQLPTKNLLIALLYSRGGFVMKADAIAWAEDERKAMEKKT